MVQEPFIDPSKRPDLTINLESRVGDITVRQLSEILGSAAAKSKELPSLAKEGKDPLKEDKDIKDNKDHKEPKDHKDQKDNKDHKDPKDQKDQKDQKDPKDHKDQKDLADQKASKDPKDQKDQKDQKDHKNEHKEQKDIKDHKDRKEDIVDKHSMLPEATKAGGSPEGSAGASLVPSGLEELIHRLTRLEQDVADMKKGRSAT
jgi:hypothetical protein